MAEGMADSARIYLNMAAASSTPSEQAFRLVPAFFKPPSLLEPAFDAEAPVPPLPAKSIDTVSYTHLRAHETSAHL
eukprot:4692258-Alexandrium_andersonii.AAC.1